MIDKESLLEIGRKKGLVNKEHIEKAARISPDKDDNDFLALAMKLKCPLWTRDQKLRKQHSVKITDTSDIIALIW